MSHFNRNMAARRVAAVSLAMIALTGPAAAAVVVFHSPLDDGTGTTASSELSQSSVSTLYLWIEKGDTASSFGTECVDGAGDEICAWDVEIALSGDITISEWLPNDGSIVGAPSADAQTLRINSIVSVPAVGPVRLGQLDVLAGTAAGSIDVNGVGIVNAARTLESVTSTTVATVPEPGALSLLLPGILALSFLGARRRRHGRVGR